MIISRQIAKHSSAVAGRPVCRILKWAMVSLAACLALACAAVLGRRWVLFEPQVDGGAPSMRLISADQYVNAVQDVFGKDIRVEVNFAPPQRTDVRRRIRGL